MAGDKKIAQSEPVAAGLKSDTRTKLAEQSVVSKKDRIPADVALPYSGGTNSTARGENNQKSVAEQGFYYPPTSCYDYHYPGYSGTYSQLDDHGYISASGGSYTGYPHNSVSYGSEAMPCYSWDSTYVGDVTHGTTAPWNTKYAPGSNGSVKSNGFNSKNTMNTSTGRTSNLPLDMQPLQGTASSNISKSILQAQRLKSLNKLGSGFQSGGVVKGVQSAWNFSSFNDQNQGFFPHSYPLNYSPSGRVWNDNEKFKLREKSYRHGESEVSPELTRGPRGNNNVKPMNLSADDGKPGLSFRRDQYNLEDFPMKYDNAKFYVIKSYSEDDVHKCIKYDVWSSTPNGNKKLDAAFHEAEEKTGETGVKCPVFLFFSVNSSGQFVGMAEMIGRVDFEKNMEFWQLDKWSGFFPVKWHIIKDVPNTQLRHIILENNDNRPVTYTRDTQEVGIKQGLEMLNIFKSYSAKTSLLDDFNFYESREKLLKAKRSSKATFQPETYKKNDYHKNLKAGERIIEETSISSSDPTSSLIDLTRNLSLNSKTMKTSAVASPGDKSAP